jgi:hypothetical protein
LVRFGAERGEIEAHDAVNKSVKSMRGCQPSAQSFVALPTSEGQSALRNREGSVRSTRVEAEHRAGAVWATSVIECP